MTKMTNREIYNELYRLGRRYLNEPRVVGDKLRALRREHPELADMAEQSLEARRWAIFRGHYNARLIQGLVAKGWERDALLGPDLIVF